MLEGARVQVFFGACGRQSSMTVLEGAGVLHRPFLRTFRGVGIFSVARHVYAQQLGGWCIMIWKENMCAMCNWSGFFLLWSRQFLFRLQMKLYFEAL